MTDTLYRRYRPLTFADLVDQRHVRITLEHALTQDRVAHAYIFTGPRGVGKTTVARLFARAVNCQARPTNSAEPCNNCPTCTAQLTGASLDVIEIDAASHTGVDNVRENIIESARSIPAQGKYKVFIIDEVHMLSTSAFNALLKLLEEPPAHALFVLATTELHRVPETVISRTQRFDFKKIRVADIVTRLEWLATAEQRQLATGIAERIARAADGSLRDAESMLTQLFSFPEKVITVDLADLVLPRSDRAVLLELATAIVHGQTVVALQALHKFSDDGGDVQILVHELVALSRALMLAAIDRRLMEVAMATEDATTLEALATLAASQPPARTVTIAERLLEAERQIQHAPIPAFSLEVAIITLGGSSTVTPLMSEPLRGPTPVGSSPRQTPPPEPPAAPTEKPVVPKKTKAAKKSTEQLDLAAVTSAWASVQHQATAERPGLALSIKLAHVQDIRDQLVTMSAPFKLHVERLNAPTQRAHLAELMSEVLGQPITLEFIQGEAMAAPLPATIPESLPTANPPVAGITPTGPTNDLWDQVVANFS